MNVGDPSRNSGLDLEGIVTFILVVFLVFIFATVFVLPEVAAILLLVGFGVVVLAALVVAYRAWRQHRESIDDTA